MTVYVQHLLERAFTNMKKLITLRGIAKRIGKSPGGAKAAIQRAGIEPAAYLVNATQQPPALLFSADVVRVLRLAKSSPATRP